jgi:hypothetical protein
MDPKRTIDVIMGPRKLLTVSYLTAHQWEYHGKNYAERSETHSAIYQPIRR